MDTKLLLLFICLNATNVIIQTIKSLCTINGGKIIAATANAIAYGLYTVVVVYMVCDLPLLWKVFIIGSCNFIGVFLVKWFEEKTRKEKLWKIEATIPIDEPWTNFINSLKEKNIPCNYIDIGKYVLVNCYCSTQEQSKNVKGLLNLYNAKYFVGESKKL